MGVGFAPGPRAPASGSSGSSPHVDRDRSAGQAALRAYARYHDRDGSSLSRVLPGLADTSPGTRHPAQSSRVPRRFVASWAGRSAGLTTGSQPVDSPTVFDLHRGRRLGPAAPHPVRHSHRTLRVRTPERERRISRAAECAGLRRERITGQAGEHLKRIQTLATTSSRCRPHVATLSGSQASVTAARESALSAVARPQSPVHSCRARTMRT